MMREADAGRVVERDTTEAGREMVREAEAGRVVERDTTEAGRVVELMFDRANDQQPVIPRVLMSWQL